MQSQDLLLPLNDGVPQTINAATGATIPTSLTGLTSDPYRGLEYSILKNKSSKLFAGALSTPGLDKMTGFYSDFFDAAAYRGANNGLGLPYLSPFRYCDCDQVEFAGTMLITTVLLYRVAVSRWQWPRGLAVPVITIFGAIDATFLVSNSLKIIEGGWFSLLVGTLIATLMLSWQRGSSEVRHRLHEMSMPLK